MGILDKVKSKELAAGNLDQVKEKMNGDDIQKKVMSGISSAIETVSKEREEYYKSHPVPQVNEIAMIIENYSNKNALISGAAGMIPGPWGMAASIPEIVAIIRNQMSMIHDIAKIYNHDKVEKELILGILFGALGNAGINLFIIHGQKVMAKRVGARVIQKLITILGGKITQQMAKAMAAKWLPVAGAVAMAAWSKYMTHKIGNKATELFSKEIIFESDEVLDVDAESLLIENNNSSNDIPKTKIQILINLMRIDGKIDEEEIKLIQEFIQKSNLSSENETLLVEELKESDQIKVDYTPFKENQEEALYLLLDLIALAKIDGEFHATEKIFIKNIGKTIEFNEHDLAELMK